MKTIVVFGDSLTWGYKPENELLPLGSPVSRFGDDERWPGVLEAALGDGFRVIPEGLNGRTTVWEDPTEPCRRGLDQLIPVLETRAPFDMVILMLGTNDVKGYFSASARDIARGMARLVSTTLTYCANNFTGKPLVLLVSPPHIGEDVDNSISELAHMGALAKSKELAGLYQAVAEQYGVGFFDAATVATASAIDQVHLDVDQHASLGHGIAPVVRGMLAG